MAGFGEFERQSRVDPFSGATDVGRVPGPSVPALTDVVVPAPVVAPVTPAAPTPFKGSSFDTLYGIDSESFLSDDQRKLARQIQGKFDASMNRRDRELQRYASPRLSSFVEDEALARAMALSRGLNLQSPDVLGNRAGSSVSAPRGVGGSGGGGGSLRPGGSSGMPALRNPTTSLRAPAAAKPAPGANWQQIMSGLASIAPLLFGKDAFGQFMNKGLLGTIKDAVFGPGSQVNDQVFEQMVTSGAFPDAGGFQVNPFTGMPIAPTPGSYDGALPPDQGAGWWGDNTYYPDASAPWDMSDPYGVGGWDGGWDPGAASGWDGGGMWDEGFWFPTDAGADFSGFDPYAIGGW